MLVKPVYLVAFLKMSFASCSHQPSANELSPKQFELNPSIESGLTKASVISDQIRAVLDKSNEINELTSPNGYIFKAGIYQHYKGPLYQVVGACKHTETAEELVYYRSLYGDFEFWARPLSMFFEDVEYDGKIMPRFTFIE